MAEEAQPSRRLDRLARRVPSGRAAVVYGLVVLFAFDALKQLDGLLRGMHRSGRPSFGAGDLVGLLEPTGGRAERVVGVWSDHAASYAGLATAPSSYGIVFGFFVAIDCLFALAIALLLFAVVNRLEAEVGEAESGLLPLRARNFVFAAFVADITENIVSAFVVGGAYGLETLLWAATWAKFVFYAVALVLVAALVALWALGDERRLARIRTLRVLRIHMVIVGLFALALIAHEQIPDLIRRWSILQLLATLAFVAFFVFMVWVLSVNLARTPTRALPPRWRSSLVYVLLGLAAAEVAVWIVLRLIFDAAWDLGYGLAIPVGLGVLVWLIGKALPAAPPEDPAARAQRDTDLYGRRAVPALLAAAIPLALGLGILRASFGDGVHTRALWHLGDVWRGWHGELHPTALVFVAVVLLPIAAWATYEAAFRSQARWRPSTWIALVAVVAFGQLLFAVPVWADPLYMGERFGGVSLLAAALAGVTLNASALVIAANTIGMPRSYEHVRVRRIPLLLLLVAWLVVAARLDAVGPHDVRVLEVAEPSVGPNLEEAWACWLVKNGLEAPQGRGCTFAAPEFPHRAPAADGGVPLVFVASSGGATRAAYFTATVLDCAFEGSSAGELNPCGGARAAGNDFRRTHNLFGLSGISGGSVGVSTFALHLAEKANVAQNDDWVDERLERDFLSPTTAWALFVEAPQAFFRFRHPRDRAEVLEASWEEAWEHGGVRGDVGLLELWRDRHEVPLLLLNGASVEDGCRFNGSALDGSVETEQAGSQDCRATGPFDERVLKEGEKPDRLLPESVLPATRDLVDFLCGKPLDVRVSTAAIMSARFPYVSPSARLESRCDPQTDEEARKVTYVVDGGYLETSGASTVVELWEQLETLVLRNNATQDRCVVPYMIQIDNGYEDDAAAPATARPSELLAPGQAIVAARGARAAQAKAAAGLLFNRPFPSAGPGFDDRYAHFVIQTHAGPKAPLGWALSKSAREELRDQLLQPKNAEALKEVRQWLEARSVTCAPRGERRPVSD